jgi:hypothetical protein
MRLSNVQGALSGIRQTRLFLYSACRRNQPLQPTLPCRYGQDGKRDPQLQEIRFMMTFQSLATAVSLVCPRHHLPSHNTTPYNGAGAINALVVAIPKADPNTKENVTSAVLTLSLRRPRISSRGRATRGEDIDVTSRPSVMT